MQTQNQPKKEDIIEALHTTIRGATTKCKCGNVETEIINNTRDLSTNIRIIFSKFFARVFLFLFFLSLTPRII